MNVLRGLALAIAVAATIVGCAPPRLRQPTAVEISAHEEERKVWYAKREAKLKAELSAWSVSCTDDHHGTADRRCKAENGNGFQVVFLNGNGPFVQAGPFWHIDRPSVVRVDTGTIHTTGRSKKLLPADALVKELLRGKMA